MPTVLPTLPQYLLLEKKVYSLKLIRLILTSPVISIDDYSKPIMLSLSLKARVITQSEYMEIRNKSKAYVINFIKSKRNSIYVVSRLQLMQIFESQLGFAERLLEENNCMPNHIAQRLLSDTDICMICMNNLDTSNIVVSKCGHFYCSTCLAITLSLDNPKCGECRVPFR